MANGRVITGYSMPRVALYSAEGNTVTYTNVQPLARGVDVSIEPETADSNDFYADNVLAETASGQFSGGTLTLNVDGLKDAARTLIMGLPEPTEVTVGGEKVNVFDYDNRQIIPYVGVGFVVRYMEEGVTSYMPVVLPKVQFAVEGLEAATQEDEIDWQTQELTASIMRDDTVDQKWRRVAAAQTTEAKAVAVIEALLA
jgi:phi13 family phage major tail protein